MTHENFCYWIQGFNEINGGKAPTVKQWEIIRDHLNLVFNKVTPNRSREIYDVENLNKNFPRPPNTGGIVLDTKYCKNVPVPDYSKDGGVIPFGPFPKTCGDASVSISFPGQILSATC